MSRYRLFTDLHVNAVRDLSPSFRRITFSGSQLRRMTHEKPDQHITLIFPNTSTGFSTFPACTDDWHTAWQEIPAGDRNPISTCTIRALRPEQCELDVDFAIYGDNGPASAYAISVNNDDPIYIIGPDGSLCGPPKTGVEWKPPHSDATLMIVGDETAVPAILSILEQLPLGHARRGIPCGPNGARPA